MVDEAKRFVVVTWPNGYRDFIPNSWLRKEGQWDQIEHEVRGSDNKADEAHCSLQVSGSNAVLDYGKAHAGFNLERDHFIGVTKIIFTDDQRQKVDQVYWRGENENDFELQSTRIEYR